MGNTTLQTITYREHPGKPMEWSIDCLTLGQVNLLVGKNATGKSRALNIIAALAKIIRGEIQAVPECGFDATFIDSKNRTLRYILRATAGKVLEETVFVDGEPKLKRDEKSLELYYESAANWITHEPSDSEISAVARKDKKQHPFLLPLHDWAEALRHYNFGSSLGKESIAIGITAESLPDVNDRDQSMVVGIFRKGKTAYPGFVDAVTADMKTLGYSLLDVDATVPAHMQFTLQTPGGVSAFQGPGKILALGVREAGIGGMYFQDTMSQGMFRALSVLIQVHFSQMSDRAHCIVIDDIGEGLDFDRSSQLIEILRRKAKESKFQLIMATNDQFVMNHVPLDEWSVLQRNGNRVSVRNIHNSKQVFEDFRFVGLSNFAFFEMDFANPDNDPEDAQMNLEGVANDE